MDNQHKSPTFKPRLCEVCKNQYPPKSNRQKYCSPECEKKTIRKGPQVKNCLYCGNEFLAEGKTSGTQKYCPGTNCQYLAGQHRKGIQPLSETLLKCQGCWRSFVPAAPGQLFHSKECREWLALAEELNRDAEAPSHLNRFVTCQICQQVFHGRISAEHFTLHELDVSKYLIKFPESSPFSETVRWKQGQQGGCFISLETKTKMLENRIRYYESNPGWAAGLSKETDPRIAKQAAAMIVNAQQLDYVNAFKGKHHSPETLKVMSEKSKELWKDPAYQKKHGYFISKPQRDLFEAMRSAGLVDKYGFEMEVFVTLKNGKVHPLDIASRQHGIAIEVDGCYYHGCPTHCRELDKTSIVEQVAFDKELSSLLPENYQLKRFWQHEVQDALGYCIKYLLVSTL